MLSFQHILAFLMGEIKNSETGIICQWAIWDQFYKSSLAIVMTILLLFLFYQNILLGSLDISCGIYL